MSDFHAVARARALDAFAEGDSVDVLVVGGGVSGVGVALDAVSRGLSVALVEAHDLAHGTSRWSSKLVHGGLRYLATGDVGVARESARERHRVMSYIAPHLVRTMPQLIPFVPGVAAKQRVTSAVGMSLGEALRLSAGTSRAVLPGWRPVGREGALSVAPALRRAGLSGGLLAYDGQLVDDARLVANIARTAAGLGARILTRVRALQVSGEGALVRDCLTGAEFSIPARCVVVATGVWAGELDAEIAMRPSRGTHVVVPASLLGNPKGALTVPVPGSISRYLFALPQQHGRVAIGLTDTDAPGPIPDVPEATGQEVAWLLETFSRALEVPLTQRDVIGAYAGLRPLVSTGESAHSADVSRRHLVRRSGNGAWCLLGGKLTTYRAMAEDVLAAALPAAGLSGTCRTATLPLAGAWRARGTRGGPAAHARAAARAVTDLAAELGDAVLARGMVERHGADAERMLELASCAHPGERIARGIAIARAEVEFAVTHEGALDAADVLDRRTRIGVVDADRASAEDAVAELVEQALQSL